MKKFKRNAVIITVVLFVGVAVYLNWAYNRDEEKAVDAVLPDNIVTESATAEEAEDAGLYYSDTDGYDAEYFAAARLSREEARAAAATTLATVSEASGATEEMVSAALSEISSISETALRESEVESLIKAKGFDDCVVYMSDSGVNVTVPSPVEGLSAAAVARITDIITSETEYTAADLKIIEIRNV